MFKHIPIPTAGVMLGMAALGNLLAPYSLALKYACAAGGVLLGLLLLFKLLSHPQMVREELDGNPILASVSATFFMALMQLAAYGQPFFPAASQALWLAAAGCQILLMVWFTWRWSFHFDLKDVFPTWFIAYVGIAVTSVTAPVFGWSAAGETIFWFALAAYAVMFVLVTARYVSRHTIAEPARPLFCIYTAPMSLSLAAYLACVSEKSPLMIMVMAAAAQVLFLLVLSRMPRLLRLPFYPSFAAFTFPFVITAAALGQATAYLRGLGMDFPAALDLVIAAETAFAAVIVTWVFVRYLLLLTRIVLNEREKMKSDAIPAEEA